MSRSVAFHQSCHWPGRTSADSPGQQPHRPVEPHRQLALEDGDALHQPGMGVLANDPGAGHRQQLRPAAALRVLPGQLEDAGELARDGVLQPVADENGRRSAGAPGSGCDTSGLHENIDHGFGGRPRRVTRR
jgi:hypothetical protein